VPVRLSELSLVNDVGDVGNQGDLARTEGTELRDQEEFRLAFELFDGDKGRA